jgi:TldD protein
VGQVTIDHADEMLHFLVVNSDGTRCEDTLPLLYMRINVFASKNGRRGTGMERLSRRLGAEQMANAAPEAGGREAARMAVAMCDAAEAPSGEMPVVLGAGGGVLFHEAVGHGLEGDAVRKGTSFFKDLVGQTVASEHVSVRDTGALPELRGSYNVDDEGTPPRENLLIDKGVLRGFLNDRITAAVLKAERTGNGRRQSYRFPPLVRMSNTFLAPGTDMVEEIIKETKSGLFARNLGGGEVDTATGNFTFGVLEGYLIEDGRIAGPVSGANLVGNGPEIMKRIDRVGPDQKFWAGTCGKGQWVPVSSGAPTLRISSMTVGGSRRA